MHLIKIILFSLLIFFTTGKSWGNSIDMFEEVEPRQLPNLIFYDLKNNKYFLENFTGNVLILHFWATWCSNCKDEMSNLDFFQKKLRDKPIIVLPISEDFKGSKVIEDFYKDHGITHLLAFIDKRNENFSKLDVKGLPTTIIIDSSGNEVARATGNIDWKDGSLGAYMLKFAAAKPVANEDYINLMQKQFDNALPNVEAKKIDKKNPLDLLPPSAVTNLAPVDVDNEQELEQNKELPKEIKVSNMDSNEFYLKIRRPANQPSDNKGKK